MKLIHQSISSDDLLLFERVLYGFKYRKNISEVHCSFMQRLLENSLMSPTQGFKLPADFISKGIPEKSILNKRITTDIVASRTLDCLVSHPSPNAEKLALQALNFPDATVVEHAIKYLHFTKYNDIDSLLRKWMSDIVVKYDNYKGAYFTPIYLAQAILDGEHILDE